MTPVPDIVFGTYWLRHYWHYSIRDYYTHSSLIISLTNGVHRPDPSAPAVFCPPLEKYSCGYSWA